MFVWALHLVWGIGKCHELSAVLVETNPSENIRLALASWFRVKVMIRNRKHLLALSLLLSMSVWWNKRKCLFKCAILLIKWKRCVISQWRLKIFFVSHFLLVSGTLLCLFADYWKVSFFITKWIAARRTSKRVLFDIVQIQLIRLTYSPISRSITLLRVIVRVWVADRSLLASAGAFMFTSHLRDSVSFFLHCFVCWKWGCQCIIFWAEVAHTLYILC